MNIIFSYKINYVSAVLAKCSIRILGIKINFKIKNPIFNAKVCNKAGVKTLLFTRVDGIGDFMISRPYIRCIKNSAKYGEYKIVFLGKSETIDILKKYDYDYIDAYISTPPIYPKDEKELFKEIQKYKNLSFNVIINPTDCKIVDFLEGIIRTIKADEKITQFGFFSRDDMIKKKEKAEQALKSYTKVIDTGSDVIYTWDREKIFFEKLLEEKLPKPQKLNEIQDVDFNSDFVTVSPFANSRHRIYSQENFAEIINYITNELKMPVVIIGGNNEYKKSLRIIENCINKDMVINKVGKLTLSESILYIRASKLLVANETGTVHIAQNYGVKTVCISNGSFMNTFHPYPENESFIHYVYPDDIYNFIISDNTLGKFVHKDINEIKPQKVIDCINKVIGEMAAV